MHAASVLCWLLRATTSLHSSRIVSCDYANIIGRRPDVKVDHEAQSGNVNTGTMQGVFAVNLDHRLANRAMRPSSCMAWLHAWVKSVRRADGTVDWGMS
jgi:hypothetical protein